MRHTCALLILALMSGASAIAADREEIYARQLDCATVNMLENPIEDVDTLHIGLAAAVDGCITVQDMAASYKGVKRYEERNPETVRKEREERKGFLVDGVMYRIETCRRNGMANGITAQACSDFLSAKKGG